MIKLTGILRENRSDDANERIDSLPKGKIFPDAKRIESIFKRSRRSWSEVIEAVEANRHNSTRQKVDIRDIHITQPNIQSGKVKRMVQDIDRSPIIDAVQFKDGEIAINDGHHRLTANWALGNKRITVNLIKVT